jgi:hypothetical protein
VELDDALRDRGLELQGEEPFLRNSREDQPRDVPEAEAPVVLRMFHEATPPGSEGSQPGEPFPDQSAADPLALAFRPDRDRAESVPVRGTVPDGGVSP